MFSFLFTTLWGKIITTFFISMVPIIELRGAIPYATGMGLSPWIAIPVAMVGNLVPIPFIIIFIKRIFAWMRNVSPKLNKVVDKMEAKADKNKDKILKYAFWGLALFVGIPLPGTGAWTGALVAAMLDMPLKKAFPSVIIGVLIAGAIMSFISYGAAAIFF
ncbi:MAG: small multi-drug export protein [Clostridia bacterium]|nr:small multi-drug export protein [Clostridia bacterium]